MFRGARFRGSDGQSMPVGVSAACEASSKRQVHKGMPGICVYILYVCMYIYICIFIHTYTCMFIFIYIYIHIHTYLCLLKFTYKVSPATTSRSMGFSIHTDASTWYIGIYLCICICIHACIYTFFGI